MNNAVVNIRQEIVEITVGDQIVEVTITGPQGPHGPDTADALAALAGSPGSALIGFTRGGPGAVSRTAQSKMAEVVSVSDFGAVGGGIVDDTLAIQAAIDSGAKEIFFPASSYAVSKLTIFNKQKMHLRGSSTMSLIGTAVNGTHGLAILQSSDICISGLTVDGRSETRGAVAGAHNITVYGSSRVTLFNVRSIYPCSDSYYVNRAAVGATINGQALNDITTSTVTLINCLSDYATRQGLSGIAYEGLTLINCEFNNVGRASVGFLAPAAGIDLEANQAAIHVPRRTNIVGCRFYNNFGGHIIVNGRSVDTLIDGCTLDTGTSYGLSNSGSRTVIRNTLIKNTGDISRPSINNASQAGYERASLTVENVAIEGAIFGGINQTSYADLVVRNTVVRDGANYGLRFTVGTDSGDGDVGYCETNGLRIERLYENAPPTSIAYIGGGYAGRLSVKNVRLVRTGATGTPIERGANFSSATNLQEISDFDAVGTFATSAALGFSGASILRNNRLNGVVDAALSNKKTGWAADTGTAKRASNATYAPGSALTFSPTYAQAELTALATRVAAIEASLQNTTQAQKAVKDDLISLKLINP